MSVVVPLNEYRVDVGAALKEGDCLRAVVAAVAVVHIQVGIVAVLVAVSRK